MSQCQILQNLPRAAGSMPWWSLCVALKGRFQAGGLNVVADQYTVYLVFVWAAQNQTGMTVSVSWPSNIRPSKSIWRRKKGFRSYSWCFKAIIKRFWSLDSQLWKKKNLQEKVSVVRAFFCCSCCSFQTKWPPSSSMRSLSGVPSCYLKTAACNWSTECNLHPST